MGRAAALDKQYELAYANLCCYLLQTRIDGMTILLNPSLINFIQLVLAFCIFFPCFAMLVGRRKRERKLFTRGKPISAIRSAQQ